MAQASSEEAQKSGCEIKWECVNANSGRASTKSRVGKLSLHTFCGQCCLRFLQIGIHNSQFTIHNPTIIPISMSSSDGHGAHHFSKDEEDLILRMYKLVGER